MSWFSDYIGKAENLLNALDSSAGDLLTNSMIEESSAGAATTSGSSIAETGTTPNISSFSSSYLNQQSPLPSFSKHARTSSSSSGGGGGWGSNYRGGSGPDSPSPPLVGTKCAAAKPFTTRSGSSAFTSTREKSRPFSSSASPSASTPSAPVTTSYSLDSSRLSQQLIRGSVGGSDYAFASASTTATTSAPSTASTAASSFQSKSNPVISSSSAPPPPEDDLLSFLNAPKSSTPISASRKEGFSSSLTPRASPVSRRSCDMESAPDFRTSVGKDNKSTPQPSLIEDETRTDITIEADEESISRQSTSTGIFDGGDGAKSTEIKSESETLIQDEAESALRQRDSNMLQSTPSSNILEASACVSFAPTFVTSSLVIVDPSSMPFRSNGYGLEQTQNVDSQRQQEATLSQISVTDENLKEKQPFIYQEEAPQDIYLARSSGKTSSSNGSSESGASTDGEEADLSDAMKESPTSPFESEPEMVTSRDVTPRGDASSGEMVTSQEGIITPHDGMIMSQEEMITSSDIRYPSSGGLTESEPEMIPSPPLEEDRLLTASQVSSSISQRFSDCEILSAAELAETEDENSSSPERKVSVEESLAMPYIREGVTTDSATHNPAANEDTAESASKGIADSAPATKGTVSSYAQGFLPLFEGVTSAFGEAFHPEQVPDPPVPNAATAADEAESPVAAEASATYSSSRLELENELLRSEIHSLNEEMRGAWHQAQLAKEERGYAEESAAATQRRARECEERMREMAEEFARERDLHAAQSDERLGDLERKFQETSNLLADVEMSLSAKDGQLAVFRVRLEEADAALEASRRRCAAVEEESRRIVADRESAVATHVTALETLKAHSDQLQEQLTIKTSESDRLREEVFSLETAFAEEKESLGSMVTSLQSEMAAEKSRSLSLQHQVNGGQNSLEGVRKELDEYRAKATKTLQSKDRLIASLQEGSPFSSSSPAALLEMEDVKSERDFLREEVTSLQSQLESSRMELADAEAQAVHDRELLEDRLSSSTQELTDFKDKIETLSTDLATSKQELSCAHEQLHRDRIQFQEETLKQSEEKDDLKRQFETQASSSASSSDLEVRLHALAENLISKQTTIESLTTEKTSLKLQLERLSSSAPNTNNFGVGNRSAAVSIAVDDDRSDFNVAQTRMRLPLFFREAPDDTGVTRGVKRAATTLDALGIKIGVFFRRYPIARVFALVYAFILHLWVFVVLLTYTPEMH